MHCLWTLPPGDADYPGRWRAIKTAFSKSLPADEPRSPVRRSRGGRGIWQRRYWEHTIRDDRDYAAHMDYTHFMAHHELMGGSLHVYKRENSRFWQCSTYLAGRNWRMSTKEESLAQAKDFAEDWYLGLKGKNRAGELKVGKTFGQAATQFRREYEIITEGTRNVEYVEGQWRRLDLHLLPFFGEKILSEITPGLLQEYRIHRREKAIAARGNGETV